MASFHTDQRDSGRNVALGILVVLVIVGCLAIVGTVEGRSLDPNTSCHYGEILTSDGVCR